MCWLLERSGFPEKMDRTDDFSKMQMRVKTKNI